MYFYFPEEKQIIVPVEKDFLTIVSLVVDMIDIAFFELHDIGF
jgi:hypothetical protein